MQDPVTGLVVRLFSAPGVALALAGAILFLALVLIVVSEIMEQRPLVNALISRSNLLYGASPESFAAQLAALDQRFQSASSPMPLVRGWRIYKSLLVRNEDQTFATSIHAADAFDRLDEPARALEWWANILVAIGLTITFLGIVAALSEATSAIAAGGGGAAGGAVESALLGLLAIAATKFWTSIAGILGSIILRLVARGRRRKIEDLQSDFFDWLDSSVRFAPPERVMIEQLAVLRRLEARLNLSPESP